MIAQPTLTVTSDFTKEFNEVIKRFKKDAVLIGIPADDNEREDDPIGNAAILAINHWGSEDGKIPPRPVLTTGIRNAQEAIAEQFKIAASTVLSKGTGALETYYERAGSIAASACKKVINDQDGIQKLKENGPTLKARKAKGFAGEKALLVTGQLRNSITYVVKSIWGK